MQPEMFIIRGPSGAGKSTLAQYLKDYLEDQGYKSVEHFEADMFHMDEEGNYNWKRENLGRAHDWCQDKTRQFLAWYEEDGPAAVIISNTSTKESEVNKYVKTAKDFNTKVRIFRLGDDVDGVDLFKRNTHDVPYETVVSMIARMVEVEGEISLTQEELQEIYAGNQELPLGD